MKVFIQTINIKKKNVALIKITYDDLLVCSVGGLVRRQKNVWGVDLPLLPYLAKC